MKIKQREKLSKVMQLLEKVIDEKDKDVFLSAKDTFHSITNYRYNDTEFYEHVLELIHKELFNIVSYLGFNTEEYTVIKGVVNTLHKVMNEVQEIYSYSVVDENGTSDYMTDREGHIVGILEWALDQIAGNIDVEVI